MTQATNTDMNTQMQKMQILGQFAGGIAHDFNNILAVIEGHTEIALLQLEKDVLTSEQLKKILISTKRGAGLTRQLLSFSRPGRRKGEKIDLAEALRQQHILLKPLLGSGVQFFVTVSAAPLWIDATEDQVTQIILNLALNARAAMPKGGTFIVMGSRCGCNALPSGLYERHPKTSFAHVRVVDSGCGIAPEALPYIFEPFFTTKQPCEGTGLGLSIVYGIVHQLQGAISVSSGEGEGTSFDIFLPLAPPPRV